MVGRIRAPIKRMVALVSLALARHPGGAISGAYLDEEGPDGSVEQVAPG